LTALISEFGKLNILNALRMLLDAMTGLVVPMYIGMSSSLPVEVKTARRSNPVIPGFYSNGINAVLFFNPKNFKSFFSTSSIQPEISPASTRIGSH